MIQLLRKINATIYSEIYAHFHYTIVGAEVNYSNINMIPDNGIF